MYYIKFQKNWDRLLSKVNDWNSILEEKSLSPNANYAQAYICSPLRAKLPEDVYANMISARAYMYYAIEKLHLRARAPHAYLPYLLCDNDLSQRSLALKFGQQLLEQCDVMLVCGGYLSQGMKDEVMYAAKHNLKMLVFNGTTYHDVCQLVKLAESRAKVEYLNKHSLMGIHAAKAVTMADRQET